MNITTMECLKNLHLISNLGMRELNLLSSTCKSLNAIATRTKINRELDILNPENIGAFISRLNQKKMYLGDEEEKN